LIPFSDVIRKYGKVHAEITPVADSDAKGDLEIQIK
jgi:hypothetical protein